VASSERDTDRHVIGWRLENADGVCDLVPSHGALARTVGVALPRNHQARVEAVESFPHANDLLTGEMVGMCIYESHGETGRLLATTGPPRSTTVGRTLILICLGRACSDFGKVMVRTPCSN
jgi:hypothetical protein